MNVLRKLRFRLRALFHGAQLDREMDDEMRFHLEMEARENAADGVAADEARRVAAIAFGGRERVREEMRDARGVRWIEDLARDLRLAARTLRKTPGFTVVAVITLAIGIAATTSLFSVVNGLLRDPLPYPHSERLAQIWEKDVDEPFSFRPLSAPDFLDLQDRTTSFAESGVFSVRRFNLGGDHPASIQGAMCTPGVFRALGVQPALGRWFTTEDDAAKDSALVILSHGLWKQLFAANPECLGRTIRLDARDYTIVGVMPENFALLSAWTREKPLVLWTLLSLQRGDGGRRSYWLGSMARLKPDASYAKATAELRAVARDMAQADANANPRNTFWLMPLERQIGGIPALRVSMLLAAGWTLLVLAGQNVCGMFLARGVSRQPEMAVRVALGARRGHIVRLVLMESFLVSIAASAIGFLLTLWGIHALAALLPVEALPRSGLRVDASVLGTIIVLTLFCTQAAGLSPALLVSRLDVNGGLKEGGLNFGRTERTQRKLRRLVIAQVAFALGLVSIAMQLSGGYRSMIENSGALVSDDLFTAALAAKEPAYTGETRVRLWNELLSATAALPGVRDAGVTTKLPFDGGISRQVLVDDETFSVAQPREYVEISGVSPGFFAAIDATLLQGRLLTRDDALAPSHTSVVINRAMARRYWPGQNPIGRHVRPAQEDTPWSAEVVGVIDDVRQVAERPARPEMYHPYSDEPGAEAFLVVRTVAGIAAPADAIRAELQRLDSDLAFTDLKSLRKFFGEQSRVFTVATKVVDMLTVAVLGLAALGLYGALSFHFARRERDIGVRVALGANASDIVRMVLRQAATWVAIGIAAGAMGAWLMGRIVSAAIADANPFSVSALALSIAAISGAALLASLIPARRATRVDPMTALRAE